VKGRLLLDVVIRKGPSILELFSSEDQPLLIWGDSLLVLDLGLDILDGIAGLNLQGDGLSRERFHEDLHSSPQPEDQVKGRLLLDVVIRKGPSILELFSSEDQPLLIWGDSLLVLDLGLDVLNGVRRFNL